MESSPREANSPFRGFSVNILRERLSVCIRVTGAWPRATCVSAAIRPPARVSLPKEPLLRRFYRRAETPVPREGKPRNRPNVRNQRHSITNFSTTDPKKICVPRNRKPRQQMRALHRPGERERPYLGLFFFLSLFLPWRKRLRLETEGERERERNALISPRADRGNRCPPAERNTIHLRRVPLFVDTFDLPRDVGRRVHPYVTSPMNG